MQDSVIDKRCIVLMVFFERDRSGMNIAYSLQRLPK